MLSIFTIEIICATEIKKSKTKSQARRKRRQNKKGLNLCFMAKKEDDASNLSSSTSSNVENYSQLLHVFQETHEEANRLALLNNLLNQVCSSFEESKSFEFDGRMDILVVAELF